MKNAHPAEMFLSKIRSAWQAVVVSGCHPGVEWWLEHSTSKYKIRMHTLFTVRFNEVCMCIKQLMTNVCIIIPNDHGAYSNKPSHNMCFFDLDSTVVTHLPLHHLWCEGIGLGCRGGHWEQVEMLWGWGEGEIGGCCAPVWYLSSDSSPCR